MPTVSDQYALLNGLRFHYREWGDAGARPLLLLHGLTGHARFWDTFAKGMAGSHRVIALDARGHGESQWADDYSPPAMARDVGLLVAALGLQRLSVVGLSMGGTTAYHYALDRPSALERLVIVDIAPEVAAVGGQRIRGGMEAATLFDSVDDLVAHGHRINPNADRAEVEHRFRNNALLLEDGRWTFRHDVRGLLARERGDPAVLWAALPRIAVPTLLVRGGTSDVLDPAAAARVVGTIPGCKFVEIPATGHSVPMENPAGFLEAVRAFLEA